MFVEIGREINVLIIKKMKLSTYSKTAQGYSHIKKNKICQDYSSNFSADDKSLFVAIVSDGHGSETYCRSDRGSRFACEIAMEAIKGMSNLRELFKGKSAQVPVRKQQKQKSEDDTTVKFEDIYPQIKEIDSTIEHLFQHIYSKWVQRVENDWKEKPPTQEELQLLGNNEIVKAYGATLMAFVRTPDYWFGFHIGDGKCLACNEQGKWYEPILWDSECFLNITTSLCQSEACKSFRYSFSGKGDFPVTVMLGTDGIDDSWGDKLPAYYTSILDDISKMGLEKAKESLSESLSGLSKNGSGDDVSVAWIVDEDAIAGVLSKLLLNDLQQENTGLCVRNKQLEDSLKRIKDEQKEDKDKYNSDIKKLNDSVKASKEKIEQLQNQMQKLEQKTKELEKDKSQLKEDYEKSQRDYESKIKSLSEEKEFLSKSLSEAKEKIEKLQKTEDKVVKKKLRKVLKMMMIGKNKLAGKIKLLIEQITRKG
jgi:predicted  nucleic acid-binding Zn-ribbon protein